MIPKTVLNKDTLIPLGVVVTIITVLTGGIFWAASISFGQRALTNELKSVRSDLSHSIDELSNQIKDVSADRWTSSDMKMWAELLRAQNPALMIPMPQD